LQVFLCFFHGSDQIHGGHSVTPVLFPGKSCHRSGLASCQNISVRTAQIRDLPQQNFFFVYFHIFVCLYIQGSSHAASLSSACSRTRTPCAGLSFSPAYRKKKYALRKAMRAAAARAVRSQAVLFFILSHPFCLF